MNPANRTSRERHGLQEADIVEPPDALVARPAPPGFLVRLSLGIGKKAPQPVVHDDVVDAVSVGIIHPPCEPPLRLLLGPAVEQCQERGAPQADGKDRSAASMVIPVIRTKGQNLTPDRHLTE